MESKKSALEDRLARRLEKVLEECLKTNGILQRIESMSLQSLERLKCKEYRKRDMIHGMVYFRKMLVFLEDIELNYAKIVDGDSDNDADSDCWERSIIYKSAETLHNHGRTSSIRPPDDDDNEGSQLPSTNQEVDVSQCCNLTDKLPMLHPEVIMYNVQNSSIQNESSQQELFKDISLLDCFISDIPTGTKFSYEKALSEMYKTSVPPASDETNSRLIELNGTSDTSEKDVIYEKPILSDKTNEMSCCKTVEAIEPDKAIAPEKDVTLEKAIISDKAAALMGTIESEKAKEKTITTVIASAPIEPITSVATVVPSKFITVTKKKDRKRGQKKKGKFAKNIENVKTNTNESKENLETKSKTLDSDANIATAINKVEHDTVYQLPAQEGLEFRRLYNCTVTWAETPEEIFVCDRPNDLKCITDEMTNFYSNNQSFKKFKSSAALDSKKYYACYNSGAWFRCMITSFNVENNPSLLKVYLIDVGKSNILTSCFNLKPLLPQFCKVPALCRACHLSNLIKPSVDSSGTWPSAAIAYLKELIYKDCVFFLMEDKSETLGVSISVNDQDINCYFYEQKWGESVSEGVSIEEPLPPMGTTEEYYDPLLAVQGYINKDEAEICKHYKGPPATTCFKGKKCTKRHELIHPDGWTKDKSQIIYSTLQDISYPDAGSEIDVLVTFIKSDSEFIGQIVQRHVSTGRTNAQFYPKTMDRLIESMNATESSDNKYTYYSVLPALGELLEAKYPQDNYWYRAKVTGHENDEVEVYFVDYGNSIRVHYTSLRHINENHLFLPIQGVLFSIGNISPPEQALKDNDALFAYRLSCKEILGHELLNRTIRVTVLSLMEKRLSVIINGEGSKVIESLRLSCNTVVSKRVPLKIFLGRKTTSYMPG